MSCYVKMVLLCVCNCFGCVLLWFWLYVVCLTVIVCLPAVMSMCLFYLFDVLPASVYYVMSCVCLFGLSVCLFVLLMVCFSL